VARGLPTWEIGSSRAFIVASTVQHVDTRRGPARPRSHAPSRSASRRGAAGRRERWEATKAASGGGSARRDQRQQRARCRRRRARLRRGRRRGHPARQASVPARLPRCSDSARAHPHAPTGPEPRTSSRDENECVLCSRRCGRAKSSRWRRADTVRPRATKTSWEPTARAGSVDGAQSASTNRRGAEHLGHRRCGTQSTRRAAPADGRP